MIVFTTVFGLLAGLLLDYGEPNNKDFIADTNLQHPGQTLDGNRTARMAVSTCSWSINKDVPQSPFNQPLYINPSSTDRDVFGFFMPTNPGDDVITVSGGDPVRFVCPGGHFTNQRLGQDVTLTCDSGYRFLDANNNGHQFQDMHCNTLPQDEVKRISQDCGTGDPPSRTLSLNKVGYAVYADFYHTYEFCFDHTTTDTVYSHFRIDQSVRNNQKNFQTSSFVADASFYPNYLGQSTIDNLYTIIIQLYSFEYTLQSRQLAEEIIKVGTDYYLARGHLAAKAYFVYGTHQASTFWYMNVIPQFASANSGNWKTLETQVRNYAYSSKRRLDVYVGSSDILTHLDVSGKFQPLYLYHFNRNPIYYKIKVPLFMWKIVYDIVAKQAVAFVLMNTGDIALDPTVLNPFTNFCVEVCPQLGWLNWPKREEYSLGFSTCCTVSSLKLKIPEIPRGIDDSIGLLQ